MSYLQVPAGLRVYPETSKTSVSTFVIVLIITIAIIVALFAFIYLSPEGTFDPPEDA